MSTQAKWLGEWWGVNSNRIRSIEGFNTGCAVKLTVDDKNQTCEIKGYELETISFKFTVAKTAGGDPRKELEELNKKVGKHATFYLNGKQWGPRYFKLLKVSASEVQMTNKGDFLLAVISVEFIEHDKKSGVGKNSLKIFYDEVDITSKISVQSIFYDSYAESKADSVKIVFNDENRLWDGWKPENEKYLHIKADKLNTGKMYVHSVKPVNGSMTLTALSIPPTSKNETSKSWEKVRLLQLAEEVAKRHGLKFEAHGVSDQTYTYVKQGSIPDFEFLEERAKLEGCAFLVYNRKLVLYSEKSQEATTPTKTITLKENSHYVYNNNSSKKIKSVKLINSEFTGNYETSDTDSTKEVTKKLNIRISDQAEADRFAKNYLRAQNKNGQVGELKTSFMDDVAAGSVINLKTDGVESWSGPAFVYHIRHDLVNNKSKVWIRKPLND